MNISFKNIHLKMLSLAAIVVMLASFTACKDELDFGDRDFGDGMAKVSASITFYQNIGNLSSRAEGDETNTGGVAGGTPGDAIGAVESLCVLLYTQDGNTKEWRLFKSYTQNQLTDYNYTEDANSSTSNDAVGSGEHQAEQTTGQATFKFPTEITYGTYRIYAVANMGDLAEYKEAIQTEEGLKKIQLEWQTDIAKNNQMFGYFDILAQGASISSLPSKGFQSPDLVIDKPNMDLHAWLKRVVSKVTVAFDATNLNDNIWIYIKSVEIKDIPATCFLGADNPAEPDNTEGAAGTGIKFAAPEPAITYNTDLEGAPTSSWQYLANAKTDPGHTLLGAVDPTGSTPEAQLESLHGETVKALFFYENLQGVGQEGTMTDKRQDVSGKNNQISYEDGVKPDNAAWKDAKKSGSYIEVKAYYVSTNEGDPGQGDIIYRFMLGRDVTTDYNAYRNYHYKLTLCFNGYANDIDWHIDYQKQVLEVEQPEVMNYQWQYFTITEGIPNLGYNFTKDNVIEVKSYIEEPSTGKQNPEGVVITYSEDGENFTEVPGWLTISGDNYSNPSATKFNVSLSNEPEIVDIDKTLQGKDAVTNYNLANPGGTGIQNTANCYIVSAPGTYTFPLVYGNAITGGVTTNTDSYICPDRMYEYPTNDAEQKEDNEIGTWTNGNKSYLIKFHNYVNEEISSPYITPQEGSTMGTPTLVWQDAEGLVTNITYDATTYGSTGGIRFEVPKSSIKQGNAVIAIRDSKDRIMWSWQIWVTTFEDIEETIAITKESPDIITGRNFQNFTFDFMSMNLGWCSGTEKIKYFPPRKFKLRFTAGIMSKTIDIELKSHIAFPLGNNTYYQWGRKDPFWGNNKTWYNAAGTPSTANPQRMFLDSYNNPDFAGLNDGSTAMFPGETRLTTVQIFNKEGSNYLIEYPQLWHNPPRVQTALNSNKFISNNDTYPNLWGGKWNSWYLAINKTIYDPCPVGYFIPHFVPYTAFTTTGGLEPDWNAPDFNYTYYVPIDNILVGNPTANLFEFYTNTKKLQSTIFFESGYRDWDDGAKVEGLSLGYVWSNAIEVRTANIDEEDGILTTGGAEQTESAFNFEFSRSEEKVRPYNAFVTCDGMPVRPCKIFKLP